MSVIQKISWIPLLQKLCNMWTQPSSGIFLLCDEPLVSELITDVWHKATQKMPSVFEGGKGLTQLSGSIRRSSLFENPPPALAHLPEKTGAKEWAKTAALLNAISAKRPNWTALIGPTTLRHACKPEHVPVGMEAYLCYAPNDAERLAVAMWLFQKAKGVPDAAPRDGVAWLLDVYGNDLVALYHHTKRMQQTGCAWHEAVQNAGGDGLSTFSLLDALVQRKKELVWLRCEQFALNGETPVAVLGTLVYFFKQWVTAKSILESGGSFKEALNSVPFPAQERVRLGLEALVSKSVWHFFDELPLVEHELKQNKKPFTYLAWWVCELINTSPIK